MLLGAASTIGASFLAADRFYGFLPEANDEIAFSDFLDRANKDEFSDIFITDDLLIGKTRTGFVLETQTTLSTEQNLSYFEKGNTNIWLQSPQNTFEKWVKPAAMSITAVSLVYGGKSLFNDLNKSRSQAQFKEALHEDQIRSTAHHEAGHAIVGLAKPGIYTVGEATIKPEAGMFGHIDAMHRTKIKSHTKETLDNTVAMLMAGRAAEQVAFGDNKYGVGARADIDMAKKIATDMVLSYGMSEELGNTPHLPSIFDGMRPLQFLFMTSSKRQLVDTAVKYYGSRPKNSCISH